MVASPATGSCSSPSRTDQPFYYMVENNLRSLTKTSRLFKPHHQLIGLGAQLVTSRTLVRKQRAYRFYLSEAPPFSLKDQHPCTETNTPALFVRV